MNTGQMLITLCALVLLALNVLKVNRSFLLSNEVLLNSKLDVLAISLGTSVIEEASNAAFDDETDSVTVSDINMLTLPVSLGPEPGESYESFNDFDDFNNYTVVDSTLPSAVFNIGCEVNYVDRDNPETILVNQSWHKKLTVTVSSNSMADTITLSSVQSYWYFR